MVTPVQNSSCWGRPRAERATRAILRRGRRPQSPNILRPQGYTGVDYPTFLRDLIRSFSPIGGEGQPGGVGVRVRVRSAPQTLLRLPVVFEMHLGKVRT
jgi:hypothetical protein